MARPPDKRSGPSRSQSRQQKTSPNATASVHGSVVDLASYRTRSGVCPRCGVPFAETTLADLERCTALARQQQEGAS